MKSIRDIRVIKVIRADDPANPLLDIEHWEATACAEVAHPIGTVHGFGSARDPREAITHLMEDLEKSTKVAIEAKRKQLIEIETTEKLS